MSGKMAAPRRPRRSFGPRKELDEDEFKNVFWVSALGERPSTMPIKRKDGNPMTRKLRKMQVAERYGNLNTRTIDRWLTYPELKLS
ncbi:MAG: hypothetical protein WCE32_11470 [Pseudolabrys sp.]